MGVAFPSTRAWAAAEAKSRWARGEGVFPRYVTDGIEWAEYSGGKRHLGFRGLVLDGRAQKPLRELNGAPLMDQRVRWWPTAPGIDRHDRPPPPPPYEKTSSNDRFGAPEMRNILRMAIAAQPKGTPERERLEKLLRKIEEGG